MLGYFCFWAFGGNGFGNRLHAIFVAVNERQVGIFVGKQLSNGLANTPGRTRYNCSSYWKIVVCYDVTYISSAGS